MAGNQLGKTYCGAAEAAIHLTGRYPNWWQGRRFDRPIRMWAGSKTNEVVRDAAQRLLIGEPKDRSAWGTGLIPGDCLVDTSSRQGVADALDSALIAHVSGANSTLGFKTYDQGREKWQGETLDVLWLDEEPPEAIYSEGITRTNATGGMVFMTFTPLLGMSEVVRRYLMDESADRDVTRMTIEDAEHFTPETRAQIIASYPAHEREARTKGIPIMGSGRVFAIAEEDITTPAFEIPKHWACIAALDFGWDHPTASVKLAHDRDADIVYVTNAYRKAQATPLIHAAALKPWGNNLPFAWPHDGLQHDKGSGEQLAEQYRQQGLLLLPEKATFEDGSNGVEAGIMRLLERMETGRFKVFSHLVDWFEEFRLYHRKDGLIVKERDDLMAATRYAEMSLRFAETAGEKPPSRYGRSRNGNSGSWMTA
jgi:phage terminase large subunit-like protein